MKLPDLAWTLKQVSDKGADGFYKGEVAKKFAADMKNHNGIITEKDLADYKPVEREPLRGSYRGIDIVTAPPASAGGATMLNILNVLENFDMGTIPQGSAKSLHIIAEAMKLGYLDRYKALGDTDFGRPPIKGFISKDYAKTRAKTINLDTATPVDVLGAGDPTAFESVSTTQVSVADGNGGAVSMTYTLGADFGSGVMIEGTGILLNNQMNNFSHEETFKSIKNHKPLPFNSMAPGKRMLSTMMPTFAFKNGQLWLVTGSPGGSTIIDTVTQIVINVTDYKLNVDEATHQPRIYQGSSDALKVEPNFNPDTVDKLKQMGHKVSSDETMGSAQSIMIENGRYLGAADPRRPGALAVPTGN
jgi:gamma-glutamyltranspeptidase/glutathione hydrolase